MLGIRPGVTAIAGSGGKTTLLEVLGRELAQRGSTILCTTTKFRPFSSIPGGQLRSAEEVREALSENPLIWVGAPAAPGKWGPGAMPPGALAASADFVLVEADGSAGLPLKAHRAHEPVIPDEADQTILVVGASGLGRRIADAAHCPDLFARRAGCTPDAPAVPEIAARVIRTEGPWSRLVINQADTAALMRLAAELADHVQTPVCAGALKEGRLCLL